MIRKIRKNPSLSAVIGACVLSGCAANPGGEAARTAGELGSLGLRLTLDGYSVSSVQVDIDSVDLTPSISRSHALDVSDPNAQVAATEYGLPAGTYGVQLTAQVLDDPATAVDESALECSGSAGNVEVNAGAITQVDDLVLLCTKDGGQVQFAGGITITAEVEIDDGAACGDLVESLFIGPLSTSTGGAVALQTQLVSGASIAWEATAGTFSDDLTTYTCPDIAGTFELEATITDESGCSETVSQQVVCRSTYEGSCEQLPEKLAFEGSCGLRSPCHVTQDGCAWEANCRGRTFAGEGEGDSFPFIHSDGAVCTASLVDGELVGTCDAEGEVCDFTSNSAPAPVPYCDTLPGEITDVTACGVTYAACDIIQDGCRYQANCDGGAAILNGSVVDDELQWNLSVDDNSFRCQAPIVDGSVRGTCTQTGRGITDPRSCDDYAATVPDNGAPACDETMPSDGFALEGCGLDGLCFAIQRDCVWTLHCGMDEYTGITDGSNAFEFETADGKRCSASVVDGALTGSCEGDEPADSCGFAPVERTVDDSCFQLPTELSTGGCGAFWDCQTVQNGCNFAASCNGGQNGIVGVTTVTGVAFPGLAGYTCEADLNDEGNALYGQCTRENADGSVSECRDLTEDLGARLVISWE